MSDQSSENKIIWQKADGVSEEEYRARLGRVYSLLLRLAARRRSDEPDRSDDQEKPGEQEKGEMP